MGLTRMTEKQAMPLGDIGLLMLIAIMWGSSNIGAKLITDEMPPVFSAAVRFFITLVLLHRYLPIERTRIRTMVPLALASGPFHFAFLYTGFHMASAIGPMTVAGQLWVVFATLLSVIFLGERPGMRHWLGLGLALAGATLIGIEPSLANDLDAFAVIVGSAFFWGLSTFLARKAGDLPGLQIQAWMALLAAPLLLAFSLVTETAQWESLKNASLQTWGLIFYVTIAAGIVGNVLMFQLVRKYEVSRTTPVLLLTPVFTEIFGFLLRNEQMTLKIAGGTLLTIIGVLVLTIKFSQRKPAAISAA
jgi:O-acetylserine/cysteine efflux transporter